jgi:two-component system response regulator FixJ
MEAQEMISRELHSEPIELVPVRDEQQYFELLDEIQAGCILVEVNANPQAELNTIASLRARQRRMEVIAFSDQWQVATAVQAIKMGAVEICECPTSENQLRNAIYQAIHGNQDLSQNDEIIPKCILEKLSADEAITLRFMALGQTAKQVGAILDISVRTFHYRKKSVLRKLGVNNRAGAMKLIGR